ncbi:MAG: hypothetical protein QW038_01530 [Nanopusillaceae archaeon]
MNIDDVKKRVLDHEKEINYKEIEKLKDLKEEILGLLNKVEELKKYISQLEIINIEEISGKFYIKEDELEILYKVFNLYSELSKSFSDFYKKLIEYYMLVKKEII